MGRNLFYFVVILSIFVSCKTTQNKVSKAPKNLREDKSSEVRSKNMNNMEVVRFNKYSNNTVYYEFKNGMKVIVNEVHTAPVVSIQAVFKAGSVYEPKLASGLSHFVEHMAFKGTKTKKAGDLVREIQESGGYINAYTSYDRTVYHCVIKSRYFSKGLRAIADAIQNPVFDPVEFEREKQVIIKELERSLETPGVVLFHLFMSTTYQVHPYRYPIGGFVEEFSKVTREELVEYFNKYYAPNRMILVVAGDIETNEAIDEIKKAFQDFERKPEIVNYIPEEPAQVEKRFVYKEMANLKDNVRMIMGFKGVSALSDDLYPLDVLNILLGEGDSSRLSIRLKDKEKIVTTIGSANFTLMHGGIFYITSVIPKPVAEDIDKVQASIIDECNKIKDGLVSQQEIEKAKNIVIKNYYAQRETVESIAHSLGISELYTGTPNFDELYVERIKKVSMDDIKRVANKYLIPEHLTIAIVAPVGTNYNAPAEIKESSVKVKKAEKVVLDNGVRLIIRENHTQPTFSIYATFLGGSRFESKDKEGLSNLLSRMLIKGTKTKSAQDIANIIESVGGSIETESGYNSFGLQISALSEYLPTAVSLLADCILNPTFPEEELSNLKRIVLSEIRLMDEDPLRVAFDKMREKIFEGHPYSFKRLGSEKTVKEITRDDLISFYKRLGKTKNMVISISGDFDKNRFIDLIKQAFNNMDASDPIYPEIPSLNEIKTTINEEINKKGIQLATVVLGLRTASIKTPDKYPLEVIEGLFSGLTGRVSEKIREKEGLAYETSGTLFTGLDTGFFALYARVAPDKVDKVMELFKSEIERIKNEVVTKEELSRTINEITGEHISSLQRNAFQSMISALDELYGLGYDHEDKFIESIESVSADNIQVIANKYFDLSKAVIVKVLPAEIKKGSE